MTAATLRVLMVLVPGDGAVASSCQLGDLIRRSGVDQATARGIVRRLAAGGWVRTEPAGTPAGQASAAGRALLGLTPEGLAAAQNALAEAREGLACAARALARGGQVPAGLRAIEPKVAAGLVVRVFLDVPGPHYHLELTQQTGLPGGAVEWAITRMVSAGWLAAAPGPPGPMPRGRPPRLLAFTPAGRAAAPAAVDSARRHLDGLRRELGASGPSPERLACPLRVP